MWCWVASVERGNKLGGRRMEEDLSQPGCSVLCRLCSVLQLPGQLRNDVVDRCPPCAPLLRPAGPAFLGPAFPGARQGPGHTRPRLRRNGEFRLLGETAMLRERKMVGGRGTVGSRHTWLGCRPQESDCLRQAKHHTVPIQGCLGGDVREPKGPIIVNSEVPAMKSSHAPPSK